MADLATSEDLISLTADIVAAHVSNNAVSSREIEGLIKSVHAALTNLDGPTPEKAVPLEPAVSIRSSVKPDYIICLEDGKKLTMLKRYLRARYDMTPDQYRAKWGLAADYPMVAPNYAARRAELAKAIGLGRKPAPASTLAE